MAKSKRRAELPERLARLKHASRRWGYFAGNFEWETDGPASATAWFAGKAAPAASFRVFGHEGSGGLYALWLREGARSAPDQAPVVLLGSEGETKVLASTVDEFLSLLALDLDDLGVFDDLSAQEPMGTPGREAFLKWLAKEGLDRPRDPEALVRKARRANPGLAKLVEAAISGPPPKARRLTELPEDPVELLGLAPPPKRLLDGSVELFTGGGVVSWMQIRSFGGQAGARLRPAGHALIGKSRQEVLAALGKPASTRALGECVDGDRWAREDLVIDVAYGGPARRATVVTLVRRSLLPEDQREMWL